MQGKGCCNQQQPNRIINTNPLAFYYFISSVIINSTSAAVPGRLPQIAYRQLSALAWPPKLTSLRQTSALQA
jgi:hypothetical protein